jgi:tRNA dimethylallyltransferase
MPVVDARPPALALMGPTASGKTALALDWAERLGGEIISVDSALVYRRLDIGSAKPDAGERARAPHHLLDLREPFQPYSAAEFREDAERAIAAIIGRGRLPILVGGTGLYFRALFDGLSALPEADPVLRAQIAAEAAQRGWPALHAELERVDPQAARRIQASDPQRIQRALEVWRASGRPISDWQAQVRPPPRLPVRLLKLALWPDREWLRERIARRFDLMLAAGFLDEVRQLRADPRLHAGLPAVRAVGYRQAWEHLEGRHDERQFRQLAIIASAQLAKRQLTWLRGEPDLLRVDPLVDVASGALDRRLRDFLPT